MTVDLSSLGLTQAQVLTGETEATKNAEIAFADASVLVILNTTEAIPRGDLRL